MYPNLYYALKDWFGVEWGVFKIFYTFGIFVALSFIAAAIVITLEFRRKEKQGILLPREEIITVGRPASLGDLLLNAIVGFIFGYKLIGAFLASRDGGVDLQEYIFSTRGSFMGGLLVAGILVFLKYRDKQKQKLTKPEERTVRIWPHDRVGDLVIYALIFGVIGAKLFDNLENWDRFIEDPVKNLFASAGLTFYGGLICAAIAVCWYATKKGIKFWPLVDSAAPALMLAYAVGRIGCQVSGDGDWGVYNSAYISNAPGEVVEAKAGDFERKLNEHSTYFLQGRVIDDSTLTSVTDRTHASLADVEHASLTAPAFLPDWFVAYTYPNNVNEDGILIPGCNEKYCRELPQPVFPTPLYETIICLIFFFILWALRKRIQTAGVVFSIYLILNGLERFVIEKFRVNSEYNLFGFHPSQAELIAVLLMIAGIILLIIRWKKGSAQARIA
jgi:phosphatidylglycerol---prolipoprotein diacylglyceryl transferase